MVNSELTLPWTNGLSRLNNKSQSSRLTLKLKSMVKDLDSTSGFLLKSRSLKTVLSLKLKPLELIFTTKCKSLSRDFMLNLVIKSQLSPLKSELMLILSSRDWTMVLRMNLIDLEPNSMLNLNLPYIIWPSNSMLMSNITLKCSKPNFWLKFKESPHGEIVKSSSSKVKLMNSLDFKRFKLILTSNSKSNFTMIMPEDLLPLLISESKTKPMLPLVLLNLNTLTKLRLLLIESEPSEIHLLQVGNKDTDTAEDHMDHSCNLKISSRDQETPMPHYAHKNVSRNKNVSPSSLDLMMDATFGLTLTLVTLVMMMNQMNTASIWATVTSRTEVAVT